MIRHWKLTLAIGVLIAAGAFGLNAVYTLYADTNKAVAEATSSGTIADILQPEALNGESSGQVNILIDGNSIDDTGHSGATLTDSIMIASLDIATKKLSLISIPRDLWVNENGSYMKLNAVYTVGGMNDLQTQVDDITGLTIHHTVLVNYAAFRDMVDAVGGVDVIITSDDARGIYDPMIGFSIGNGLQHLSGDQALKLARSRNDPTNDGRIAYGLPNGDFDRTLYQRRILEAFMKKASALNTVVNPTTLLTLIKNVGTNVGSNLSVGQVRRLYDLAQSVSTTYSISLQNTGGMSYLSDYTSRDGQAALIPRVGVGAYTDIHNYIEGILRS